MAQLRKSTKWIARIFKRVVGCRHSHMSRPFTVNDEPYRLVSSAGHANALTNIVGRSCTRTTPNTLKTTSHEEHKKYVLLCGEL